MEQPLTIPSKDDLAESLQKNFLNFLTK